MGTQITMTGEQFLTICAHVLPVACKYDDSTILSYINLRMTNGVLTAVATDGSRLVMLKDENLIRPDGMDPFCFEERKQLSANLNIKRQDFIDIKTALSKLKWKRHAVKAALISFSTNNEGNFAVVVEDIHASADQPGTQLFKGDLGPGEYPQYENLFPRDSDFKYELTFSHVKRWADGRKLSEIDELSITLENIGRADDHTGLAKLNIKNSGDRSLAEITFSMSKSSVFAYVGPSIKLDSPFLNSGAKDPELNIGFNCKMLNQAINHGTPVVLRMTSPTKPAVIDYPAEPRVKHLLMPVQCK